MTNYLERERFVEADPEYKRLEAVAVELREANSNKHREITQATYKLQRLLIMRDIVLEQMSKLEDTDIETDDLLEELTANRGEAWCGMVSQGVEDIQELICDVCEQIAQDRKDHQERDVRRAAAWAKVHEKSQELRKEWNAKQEKAEAMAATQAD